MYFFKAFNIATSHEMIIEKLLNEPEFVSSPRDQKINEILNVSIEIKDITKHQIFENPARDIPKKYLANELILYFLGISSLNEFSKLSKFWNKLYPSGYVGEVNSAYGNLLFNDIDNLGYSQWEWAKNSLIKDEDSRQAIMHYNRPVHQYENNGDFVCTLNSQFIIRENKLYMTTNMRSMDLFFGYPFDVVFFTLMQQSMRLELLKYYPELELGTYTHNVCSLHIYERNFEVFENMNKSKYTGITLPLLTESLVNNNNLRLIYENEELKNPTDFDLWLIANK